MTWQQTLARIRSAILLCCVAAVCGAAASGDGPIGNRAPDFSAPDLRSKGNGKFTLSTCFAGDSAHAVALCFFAAWCHLCPGELRLLQSLSDSIGARKLQVVAVCIDSTFGERQREILRAARFDGTVVHDSLGSLRRLFRWPSRLPYSVFIDKSGVVVTTVNGYSSRAEAYIRHVMTALFAAGARRQ